MRFIDSPDGFHFNNHMVIDQQVGNILPDYYIVIKHFDFLLCFDLQIRFLEFYDQRILINFFQKAHA